ncbi:hypothetical protein QFC19_002234 [Naganishia cerealis]|uniref:Uncharacterized protein n=1 Tax=Naganishia cerealis TaxID=610337 RepID=A0ACC2WF57_9TREE|nr:hypothetical protein QFC19_002234 [Naganishia cerealis]
MRLITGIFNLFFLAGSTLLLVFIVLSGSTNHFPFNRFYWLKADTSSISHAYLTSSWTFWGVCQSDDFSKCKLGPAYPLSPVDNFETSLSVPQDFVDNRDTYYYLTRFAFAFEIISLCFAGVSLIIDILGLCFNVIDRIVIAFISFALFFAAGFAALQTAAVVLARNAFLDENKYAHIGVKMMAITWAAVVCLFIVWVITCFANIATSYRKHMSRVNDYRAQEAGAAKPAGADDESVANDQSSFTRTAPAATETNEVNSNSGGIRFFKIKRNQKVSDEDSV